jgi:hypothetical protein
MFAILANPRNKFSAHKSDGWNIYKKRAARSWSSHIVLATIHFAFLPKFFATKLQKLQKIATMVGKNLAQRNKKTWAFAKHFVNRPK